jgi:hypothetical protein
MLVEKQSTKKVQLVQYKVMDDDKAYDSKILFTPIYIDVGKELELEKEAERVFQVDDKVVLVGKDFY